MVTGIPVIVIDHTDGRKYDSIAQFARGIGCTTDGQLAYMHRTLSKKDCREVYGRKISLIRCDDWTAYEMCNPGGRERLRVCKCGQHEDKRIKKPAEKFHVLIASGSQLGNRRDTEGLLEAYLGPEDAHPWKVRTATQDVVYVAPGGVTYDNGFPVRAGDLNR